MQTNDDGAWVPYEGPLAVGDVIEFEYDLPWKSHTGDRLVTRETARARILAVHRERRWQSCTLQLLQGQLLVASVTTKMSASRIRRYGVKKLTRHPERSTERAPGETSATRQDPPR